MPPSSDFSSEELNRYGRQILLPEIGLDGQARLKRGKVLIVGAGGLGSPAAMYLAAAGVGRLGLVDFDEVNPSNLHRQLVHSTMDIGRSKLESAAETLRGINPNVFLVLHETRVSARNILPLLEQYDLVIDATDNFAARFLIGDACVLARKPNIYGSVLRFEGQASVFDASRGPCYRCLYPEPPPPELAPTCAQSGVIGVLPGVIGMIQATEAIKLLVGKGTPLIGRIVLYDALAMTFREMKLEKNPECAACSKNANLRLTDLPKPPCSLHTRTTGEITPQELKDAMNRGEPISLVDVRESDEYDAGHLPGARLIPLNTLKDRASEIDRGRPVVVYCRSGGRSSRAASFLKAAGFRSVLNLAGGILAWEKGL